MKHKEHICRFNDGQQSCDCYDAGYEEGILAHIGKEMATKALDNLMSKSYRLGVVRSARVARNAGFNDVAEDIENDTSIGEGVGNV